MSAATTRRPVDLILDAITTGTQHLADGTYTARCPAHDDSTPSLSISEGSDGRALVHCHAGCELDAILTALHLEARQLFPPSTSSSSSSRSSGPLATYPYTSVDGELLYKVIRWPGKKFVHAPKGVPAEVRRSTPYRLPQLAAAIAAGHTVYVAEGEKDVDRAAADGLAATCNSGGAGKWTAAHAAHLAGAAAVVIVADRDEPGIAHAEQVAATLEQLDVPHRIVHAATGKDLFDHLAAGHTVDELVDATPPTPTPAPLEPQLDSGPDSWQPLTPLVRAQVATFPLHVLPDWIRDEVESCAAELAVPDDMPAVAAIGALSVVAAGRVDVQPGPRYRTPTNLYVCIVAESGAGKSPVMARMVTDPARALETRLVTMTRSKVAEARAHTQRLEAARDEAAKKLKNNPSDSGERDLARAEAALEDDEPLASPVVVLSDVTPERLTAVLAEQQGRAAIVTPEGGTLFESIAGLRYRAGGVDASAKVPDVYLSGYSREALRTDRVGRSSVLVEQPTLAVITSVQPVVVERLAATPDVARQGALARFLWAWPAGRIGWRPQDAYRHAPADDGAYRARLIELGMRARSWLTPLTIDVDDDARDLRDAWATDLEARIRPGGDLHPHRAGVSKLQTTPWRLAGLLAFADGAGAHTVTIDAELMARALELCDYFLANAVAAEQVAGVAADSDSAVHVLAAKLAHHAGAELTIRDVQLAMRGTISSVADLVPPIVELEGMGWLRIDGDLSALGKRGAPNPTLFVHPELSPAALHPTIEPAELTREPRELIHREGGDELEATREPRELPVEVEKFARLGRSRERHFTESSSSLDANSQGEPRATNSTARTEPLFGHSTAAPITHLDAELGDDPFGPAHTDTTAGELW